MSKEITQKTNYWYGLAGLIPNVGVVVGAILVFLGFVKKDHKLKLVGILAMLFTPFCWLIILPLLTSSFFFKSSNIEFTNIYLNDIVKELEYYKSKSGKYPDSLGELRKQNKLFVDFEVIKKIENPLKKEKPIKFYYKKLDNDYILKSYGPDKKLHTQDDIYPKLKIDKY